LYKKTRLQKYRNKLQKMKRTDSFVEGFKIVNIEMITNVDDEMIKSISPPKTSTIDYFMKNLESEEVKSSPPTGFLDFFMNRKKP